MQKYKRKILTAMLAFAGLGATGVLYAAMAMPDEVACVLARAGKLEAAPDGLYLEAGSTDAERTVLASLREQARSRIETKFGALRSHPAIVFVRQQQAFWPLKLNRTGSAAPIGNCVLIGPNGFNIDVVAHEMMHIELTGRIGAWAMFTDVPVWFNEGVAMQVDYRARFIQSPQQLAGAGLARASLQTVRQFNQGDAAQVTAHYAFARAEVAQWLAQTGDAALYRNAARIHDGATFASVVGK